jgi:hypothetical protein
VSTIVGSGLFQDGLVSSLVKSYTVVDALNMWLQSRLAWRKASQVYLRLGGQFLVLPHHLAEKFDTDGIHRRLTILSIHQAGELF